MEYHAAKPLVLGIAGGSASGKTHFLKSLMAQFEPSEICLISLDNYYLPRHQLPVDSNGVTNFDMPESIDVDTFCKHIEDLRNGKMVQQKEYTFNNPDKEPTIITLLPAPVIVVEGIFVFYYTQIARLLDLKVFIDAKEFIKLKRRIVRDQIERGYDFQDVIYRYEMHVAPTYEKFILPFKEEADIVINNNSTIEKALQVLVAYLRSQITSQAQLKLVAEKV
jgi:uridine kinase